MSTVHHDGERDHDRMAPGGRTGSDDQWERLVSLMHVVARGLMRGRDRHRRESIDVVQSLASDLLSNGSVLTDLDPESQRRFIRVAVRNKLGMYARHDQAKARGGELSTVSMAGADGQAPGDPAASQIGASTLVCRREELAMCLDALEAVDPESRAVLMLHASGVPHEAIAELFESTDEAVRQRYVRAKRDLIILARRTAGESWEMIATEVGMNSEAVERRHARIVSGCASELKRG